MRSIIKSKYPFYVLGIFLIFVCWAIAVALVHNSYLVPPIDLTLKAFGDLLTESYTYVVFGNSILRLLITIAVCFGLALLLGIIATISKKLKYIFQPFIVLIKTLPLAVIIVVLLVIFRPQLAVYYIVGIVIFPLMYEAIIHGLNCIDQPITDEIKMYVNTNFEVVTKVYLPLALPFVITSLLQAFGLGLKVLVMAEYIAQPKPSIGNEFVYYKDIAASMEYVFAWSILLVLFVLLMELIIQAISKKISIE